MTSQRMMSQLLSLNRPRSEVGDLPGLHVALAPLVGEPFRFVRVSYGDELTLHFGDLRPARSPKLPNHQYGAYVLGVRASAWLLKAGTTPHVRVYGLDLGAGNPDDMTTAEKLGIQDQPLVEPGSRVMSAEPFRVRPFDRFGLDLLFSDGSRFAVIPRPPEPVEDADDLPELSDWEIAMPNGLLTAGPRLNWGFEPKAPANAPPAPASDP